MIHKIIEQCLVKLGREIKPYDHSADIAEGLAKRLDEVVMRLGLEMTILITPEPLTPLQTQFINAVINDPRFLEGKNSL